MNTLKQLVINFNEPRPLLKWAGGKTQLLNELIARIPKNYGKYIEPFFGGGALFFKLQPKNAIIADNNLELINFYQAVAKDLPRVVCYLSQYENTEKTFYSVRAIDWTKLNAAEAAARLLFLNKTCFNGLYRVNRSGQFNVPFGYYKNPKILDQKGLLAASNLLNKTTILCEDYKNVLQKHAEAGDLIFLDPPYLPISKYSDFKRYTKDQFYEEDHIELAEEVKRLHKLGCWVILTNSNHPLVHKLYNQFDISVIKTKRHINCNGQKRNGEDVIVTVKPIKRFNIRLVPSLLPEQIRKYPTTRYMGSKNKLLNQIWDIASSFKFESVLDLFSGSGIVGYMFKSQGKQVITNDYMMMAATFSKAMIENNETFLISHDLNELLVKKEPTDRFVEKTFADLYFSKEDNQLIDILRVNIKNLKNPYKKAIAMSALIRACMKKRPRGIFTYTGHRYDDGRRDIHLSLKEQFIEAVTTINDAIFNNGKINKAKHGDAMAIRTQADLVYIDPPYYSPLSDNEYVRRYHFVEGLARDWQDVEIQWHTSTRKFKGYPTPFSSRRGAFEAFDKLFGKFQNSILIVSYSSNSLPTLDEMVELIARHKKNVDVIAVDYKYSFGTHNHKIKDNKNTAKEYLFVGY